MASGAANPVADYNPPAFATPTRWDVVKMAGVTCPGYCTISGFDRGWGWDVKSGKGEQGTTPTYVNKQECEGDITFYLWLGQHFVLWESYRPLFLYDPTKTATLQAVSIFHPSLYDIGIKSVVTRKLSPARHIGDNLFTIVAKLLAYEPPPKANAVATPKSAVLNVKDLQKQYGTSEARTAPSPMDPLEQKLKNTVATAQSVGVLPP
jgi:hypothetical protein